MKYIIEIIEYVTETVVKRMETTSERKAERIEDGVNINLNHEDFYTQIREADDD